MVRKRPPSPLVALARPGSEPKLSKYELEKGEGRRGSDRPLSAVVSSTATRGNVVRGGVRRDGPLNNSCRVHTVENVKEQRSADRGCYERGNETTLSTGLTRKCRQAWGIEKDGPGDKAENVSGGIGNGVLFPNEAATTTCFSPNPTTNSSKEDVSQTSPDDLYLCCQGAANRDKTRCQEAREEKGTAAKISQDGQEEQIIVRLGRRILAHTAGEERLHRFVEILRVMSDANVANGGRVSGKDLLQASRDVGVTGSLTTGDLRDIGRMFRNRMDGRVPLRFLVENLLVRQQQEGVRVKQQATVPTATITQGQDQKMSSSPRGAVVAASSSKKAERHHSKRCVDKILDGEVVSEQQGNGRKTRAANRAGAVVTREAGVWSMRSASTSPNKADTSSRASSAGHRGLCGGLVRRSAASRECEKQLKVNAHDMGATEGKGHLMAKEKVSHHWDSRTTGIHEKRDNNDNDDVNDTERQDSSSVRIDERVPNKNVVIARNNRREEDPVVELARIIFNPPCSLENLIHVLQASKVRIFS